MVQLINLLAAGDEGPCKLEEILDGDFDDFPGAFTGGSRVLDETLVFRGGRMQIPMILPGCTDLMSPTIERTRNAGVGQAW
ncbi:hypothetical protein [Bradyrhizobium murdochi]|uniref:hypothetical protein n=1 Tax=Bradyrhizobium murdochi TaxID=1038859 RepID=UPI000484261A|nr:hypothetical protein [Bradyrhizobium murdochi]